jgi:hypothetical protein
MEKYLEYIAKLGSEIWEASILGNWNPHSSSILRNLESMGRNPESKFNWGFQDS